MYSACAKCCKSWGISIIHQSKEAHVTPHFAFYAVVALHQRSWLKVRLSWPIKIVIGSDKGQGRSTAKKHLIERTKERAIWPSPRSLLLLSISHTTLHTEGMVVAEKQVVNIFQLCTTNHWKHQMQRSRACISWTCLEVIFSQSSSSYWHCWWIDEDKFLSITTW